MPRTATVETAPIWRSDAQPWIINDLSTLRKALTASEIAARHGLQRMTVNNEVNRLIEAGIVKAERVGRQKLLELDWSNPVTAHLIALADLTVGLLHDLPALYDVPGVKRVAVFGSWARRLRGEPGPPPNDIDVLVETVGDPWPAEEVTLAISGRRGLAINVHTVDPNRDDAITEAILDSPLVEVRRP